MDTPPGHVVCLPAGAAQGAALWLPPAWGFFSLGVPAALQAGTVTGGRASTGGRRMLATTTFAAPLEAELWSHSLIRYGKRHLALFLQLRFGLSSMSY